jgi:CRP-like cAMP-binding protein
MEPAPKNIAFFKSSPFFAGLPEPDVTSPINSSHTKSYVRGDSVVRRGDTALYFHIIVNGWVKISRDTIDGDETILSLLTRADTFGEAAIFDGATYPYDARAVEPTEITLIPVSAIREHAHNNPDILLRLMQSMARQMDRIQLDNEHISLMSAPQRAGCLLLQLSAGMEGNKRTVHFPYDKSLAASRLGMKPETFSRALAQLKNSSVIVNGDSVEISDVSALVEFCCSDCSAATTECRNSAFERCGVECVNCRCEKNCKA